MNIIFSFTDQRSSQIEAVGVVLTNMLLSNSKLAVAYREHRAVNNGGLDNE